MWPLFHSKRSEVNSVMQRALDRTRETAVPALIVPIKTSTALPDLVINGPINRAMGFLIWKQERNNQNPS